MISGKGFVARLAPHFLLFSLLAASFLFFHVAKVVPLQKEIAAKETAWQSERPKIGQLTTLKTAQQELVSFRERLPEEGALTELVSMLSESAAAQRLTIPAISYQPEKAGVPGLIRVLISFSVKGDYRDIRNLIHRLERSPYFLILENVGLASSARAGEAIQLQLRIAAYFHEQQRS